LISLGSVGSEVSCLKLPGQDSNLDKENQKTFQETHKSVQDNVLEQDQSRFARQFARGGPNQPLENSSPARPTDADLSRVIQAWPLLPAPIKAAVLALVETAD
jgi:hypothetical protein